MTPTDPPSRLQVCIKRCDQCLFTPTKLVSDERKQELLTRLNQNSTTSYVRKAISYEVLHDAFVVRRITRKQLATELDVHPQAIAQNLRRWKAAGVNFPSRGTNPLYPSIEI